MAGKFCTQTGAVSREKRGVALLLVLGVIAAASILSWAMLSSATLRGQLDVSVQDATSCKYLADSGVSYAMYYLRYPEKSPVALTNGPYNKFYGGQSNVVLWENADGKVNIAVTNTAKNSFLIRSSCSVNGISQTSEAEVVLTTMGYQTTTAASFNGPVVMPLLSVVTGPISSTSTVKDSAGALLSSLGGSTITVKPNAAPQFSDLMIVTETGTTASTGGSDRTYTVDGNTYIAEKAPTTINGNLTTSRPTLNPFNVWWSDDDVVLNGANIAGTLIVRSSVKGVELQGTNSIATKSSKLPALVVGSDLRQRHATLKPAKLNAKGVTWVGNKIAVVGTSLTPGSLTFEGALLMGGSTPKFDDLTGTVTLTHTVAAESTQLTEPKFITGIVINRWTHLR